MADREFQSRGWVWWYGLTSAGNAVFAAAAVAAGTVDWWLAANTAAAVWLGWLWVRELRLPRRPTVVRP